MKFVKKYVLVDAESGNSDQLANPFEDKAVAEARNTKRAIQQNLDRKPQSIGEQLLTHGQLTQRYRDSVEEGSAPQKRLDEVLSRLLEKLSRDESGKREQLPPPSLPQQGSRKRQRQSGIPLAVHSPLKTRAQAKKRAKGVKGVSGGSGELLTPWMKL